MFQVSGGQTAVGSIATVSGKRDLYLNPLKRGPERIRDFRCRVEGDGPRPRSLQAYTTGHSGIPVHTDESVGPAEREERFRDLSCSIVQHY